MAHCFCPTYHGYWMIKRNKKCEHTEKSFRNLIKSNRNQIVLTIFRLIWNETDVLLVSNQSVHSKYNLISVRFNAIWKRFVWALYKHTHARVVAVPIKRYLCLLQHIWCRHALSGGGAASPCLTFFFYFQQLLFKYNNYSIYFVCYKV